MDGVTNTSIQLAMAKFVEIHQRKEEHHALVQNEIDSLTIEFTESILEKSYHEIDMEEDSIYATILDNSGAETNATALDTATAKLLNFIKQRDKGRCIIKFVSDFESKLKSYQTQCAPLIEDRIAMPFWIRDRLDTIMTRQWTTTVTDFVRDMERILVDYLNGSENGTLFEWEIHSHIMLDSDRETEKEIENAFRIFPNPLKQEFPWIFFCNNLKNLLFIPKVLQLRIKLCDPSDVGERGGLLSKYPDENYYSCPERTILQHMVTNRDFEVFDEQMYEGLVDYAAMLERMKKNRCLEPKRSRTTAGRTTSCSV